MPFIKELKRRNVIKVAIAYAIVAWILIEVTATTFPILELPGWSVTLVTALLLIGFPLALIFAWAFELTPGGIKLEKDIVRSESVTHITGRKLDFIIIAVLVLALVYFAYDEFAIKSADESVAVTRSGQLSQEGDHLGPSIAVLAFDNRSPDSDNAYFAEGISEEILNVLSHIDGLKVTSRTSAFTFRRSDTPIPEIARQLGVGHVLEGSVRKQGTQVRISAQLIDAETDTQLWSDSYNRELSDIFMVQEEIAQSIAVAMQEALGVRTVRVDTPTQDLEAYQLFLLGRQLFYRRGPALDGAITALQSAVDRDTNFVAAWGFLAAAAQITWGYDTSINDENALALAEQASRKALDLDPNLALALSVRALLEQDRRHLNEAFDFFHRAINADSNDSTILMWFGQINLHYGYLTEAIAHLEQAYDLDPLVGINNGSLGIAYLVAGQEALAQARLAKAEELGWDHHVAAKFSHLIHSGEAESAVAYLEPFFTDTKNPNELLQQSEIAEALRTRDPALVNALWPRGNATRTLRSGWWRLCLFSVLDLRDRFFEQLSRTVARNTRWRYSMRFIWLPGNRAYVEDPRFFEIMGEAGTVALWEERGYPDGCVRVSGLAGVRLDCAERYR